MLYVGPSLLLIGQYSVIWSSIDSLTEPLAGYLDFTQINNTCIKKKISIIESCSF